MSAHTVDAAAVDRLAATVVAYRATTALQAELRRLLASTPRDALRERSALLRLLVLAGCADDRDAVALDYEALSEPLALLEALQAQLSVAVCDAKARDDAERLKAAASCCAEHLQTLAS